MFTDMAPEYAIRFLSLSELAAWITGEEVSDKEMLAIGPMLVAAACESSVECGTCEPSDAPTVRPAAA